jgi:uncharacterized protein YggT (Ycf19 family)
MTFSSFLEHWYFHLPNLVMAALSYLVIARLLLEVVLRQRHDAALMKPLTWTTEPFLRLVRVITPRIVPAGLVMVVGVGWLLSGRMAWYLGCVALGMRLKAGV